MGKRKILLVDDDREYVEATTLLLEHSGYEVVAAFDGPDGLAKAKREGPDVILLDVMMSKTTEGFEVLNELRREPETRNTPVMMLTGVSTHFPGSKLDTDQLPAEMFVEKPVRPGQLLSKIEKLLEG